MSRTPFSDNPRARFSRFLASPRSSVPPNERDAFEKNVAATKSNNPDGKRRLLNLRPPARVGALAFGLFVSPCGLASTASWAQTPGDISSPPVVNREKEIDATRFSSGIYGDPAPNNPSPFVEPSASGELPSLFPESAPDAVPGEARKQLEALAWTVGCWELETAGFVFQTKIDWAPGGSYLLCRDFVRPVVAPSTPSTLTPKDDAASSTRFAALRVVGWNPVAGLFQSTIFCRDGSYGTGLWQREGESWRVATRILLVDGRAATSVEYFTPRPDGGFNWESTSRTVENTPLPNVGPAAARPIAPEKLEHLEKSMFNDVFAPRTPTTQSEFE